MRGYHRGLFAYSVLASLILSTPCAAGGQRDNYFYVTGPEQTLIGSSGDDAIGFDKNWAGYGMNYADVQSLTQNFTLSGTWSGGAGIDQYSITDSTFKATMFNDESGVPVNYTGPEIHVTFDLDKIHIVEADNDEFDRLFISSQVPLDLEQYDFHVPVGIDHVILVNINDLSIHGNVRRTDIQTEFSSDVTVYAQSGDDNLIVPGNNNTVYGGGGSDWLSGQSVADDEVLITSGSSYYGGPGDDLYGVFRGADRFIEYPGEGADTLAVYIDNYSLTAENAANMERVVLINQRDSDGNFLTYNINGSDGADTISGNDANNSITGQGSGDTISGGSGDDTLTGDAPPAAGSSLAASRMARQVIVVAGNDVLDGGSGTDTVVFAGSYSEYHVTYDARSRAYKIADTIPGRDGTDTVRNVEFFKFSDGTKSVAHLLDVTLTGTGGNDRLVGDAGYDELHGVDGNDTLIGLAGDDLLDGGTGADMMSGGDGDDSYIVDNAGDKVKENAKPASGVDTVYTDLPSYTLPSNVENLVYTGAGRFSGKGNKSANRIDGGPGDDLLDGRQGVDVMTGKGGNDIYVVDSPADLVNEDPGGGGDQVISSVTITTLSPNVEALRLSKGNISGTGNALDNVITGSTGQNTLSGGDGSDTLIGGLGNDTFYGETAASAGDDVDTISYVDAKKGVAFSLVVTGAAQNTLGAGTDRIYEVSGIENLTGSNFNDTLTGSATANDISGLDGNDAISGLAGADRLLGGKGADQIDCGADTDADRVAYILPDDSPVGALHDQVSNFTPGTDVIDLSGIDADATTDGNQAFLWSGTTPAAHSVWYTASGPDVLLRGDTDGDGAPDFEVQMKGITTVEQANVAL